MIITNVVEPPEKTEFQQRQHDDVPKESVLTERTGFFSRFLFSS